MRKSWIDYRLAHTIIKDLNLIELSRTENNLKGKSLESLEFACQWETPHIISTIKKSVCLTICRKAEEYYDQGYVKMGILWRIKPEFSYYQGRYSVYFRVALRGFN